MEGPTSLPKVHCTLAYVHVWLRLTLSKYYQSLSAILLLAVKQGLPYPSLTEQHTPHS